MNDISVMTLPLNSFILIKDNTNWFESQPASVLLGVFIAFIINKIDDYRKEKADLDRYEYALLSKTKNILEQESKNINHINALVLRLLQDLRFAKLESSKLIFNSLTKAEKGDDYSSEKREIEARLNHLKRGLVSRIRQNLTHCLPFLLYNHFIVFNSRY